MMKQENTLARYTILRELGRGPLGTVWAASDRQAGAVVAMRTLDAASVPYRVWRREKTFAISRHWPRV